MGLPEDGRQHPLRHLPHVLLAGEGHLHVELGELRLAVGAGVLVPEAPHDLEVAVGAGHHQELLEELGGLGQGEERAGLQARRHQEVPGPLGRALREHGGLDLDEPFGVVVGADGGGHPVAEPQDRLHLGTPQVEVPVAETGLLAGLGAVLDLERRDGRLGEHLDAHRGHLHLPGREVGVHVRGRAHADDPLHRHDELRAQALSGLEGGGGLLGMGDDLHDALPVAEVEEDHTPVVPPAVHPSGQPHPAGRVRGAQGAGHVGPHRSARQSPG